MHEQDVRRAVGWPGNNHDGPSALHAADYLAESMGFVLGKRVGAQTGTTLVLEIADAPVGFTVGDDGRGRPRGELPADPTVRIATDRESFLLLAGRRRTPEPGAVRVEGDPDLGRKVLASMAVTP